MASERTVARRNQKDNLREKNWRPHFLTNPNETKAERDIRREAEDK